MRYLCVHGHFYQPPRENPYLEAVELQDSAYPYHDWNERVASECYTPNAKSRILDGEQRIVAGCQRRSRGSEPRVPGAIAVAKDDNGLFLRRTDFPGRGLRTVAGQRPALCRPLDERLFGRAAVAAVGAHCDRRRELRPSPPFWGDGAFLCAAPHRNQ